MEARQNNWINELVSGWIAIGSEKYSKDKNWYMLVFPVFGVVVTISLCVLKWFHNHHVVGMPVLLMSLSILPLTCFFTLLLAKLINPCRKIGERLCWSGWTKNNAWVTLKLFGVVLLLIFLMNSTTVGIFKLFGWKVTDPELPMLLRRCSWSMVGVIAFGAVVVAPIVEEILFRRILFSFIASRVNTLAGVVITAGVFAAIHGCTVQLPALFMLGVVLQLLFISRRTLAAPIMLHIFNNAFAVTLMVLARLYGWDWVFDL